MISSLMIAGSQPQKRIVSPRTGRTCATPGDKVRFTADKVDGTYTVLSIERQP